MRCWTVRARQGMALWVLLSGLLFGVSASAAPQHGGSTANESDHPAAASAHHEVGAVNWVWGVFAESSDPDVEPNLLVRPRGMPVPVLAMVLNTLLFFGLLIHFGRRPLQEALVRRKQNIMKGFDEASKMKREALSTLQEYETKLGQIDAEITRIQRESAALRQAEEARLVVEAKAQSERLKRDAELLIEQELSAAQETLREETVKRALSAAQKLIEQQLDPAEHERLQAAYLRQLEERAPASLRSSS